MIQNTRRLFLALLPTLDVDTVCDVGSMDGTDALAFRRALPAARVQAYEANPRNAQLMQADARLGEQRIEVIPMAVTNFDGEAGFHLVKADYASANPRRGMGSLHLRSNASLHDGMIIARTTRLDSRLGKSDGAHRRIALWIDVEGTACEALEGAQGLLDELVLLHVEVETAPCISERQKLYPELEALLRSAGFELLATSQPASYEQFDALFVRADLRANLRRRVAWLAWRLGIRSRAVRTLQRICPGCLRRIMQLRRNS